MRRKRHIFAHLSIISELFVKLVGNELVGSMIEMALYGVGFEQQRRHAKPGMEDSSLVLGKAWLGEGIK